MKNIGDRILELRKTAGLTQIELAKKIEISHTQMTRYENKNVQPPADVLKRLANVLNTSIDYLVNGTTEEKAKETIKDDYLLRLFNAVDKMEDGDKTVITRLIKAFVFEKETQKRLAV